MQNARSHSSVFIRSIQVCECAFALHQEQKRDHFGTVAIDVHRIFHHDSTALQTTRASDLGWASSAALPHIQGVHRSSNTNPVDPRSPLQKLTHTATIIVSCIPNSTDVWFCPPQCGLFSFRTQNKVERLSSVDPGYISRGITDLYRPRRYAHPVTRAIEVSHAACKGEFFFLLVLPMTPFKKGYRWGHRVPPAGLPIEQVLGEYSLYLPS